MSMHEVNRNAAIPALNRDKPPTTKQPITRPKPPPLPDTVYGDYFKVCKVLLCALKKVEDGKSQSIAACMSLTNIFFMFGRACPLA